MVWQRLLFGALLIGGLVSILLLDAWLAAGLDPTAPITSPAQTVRYGLCSTGLILLVTIFGVYEGGALFRRIGHEPAVHWAAFISVGLVLTPWIEKILRLADASPVLSLPTDGPPLTGFWLTGGTLGALLIVLARKRTEKAVAGFATTAFLFLYVGLLASYGVRIRCEYVSPAGSFLLVWTIVTIKFGDIGAYAIGTAFGRTKLAPWLSPAKSVEGFFGACIFTCIAAAGGMWLWKLLLVEPAPLDIPQVLIFGIFMGICGTLGDLAESALKRDVGAKDSGQLVPSFGGLLDLLDSPLFCVPIAWWLLTTLPRIG